MKNSSADIDKPAENVKELRTPNNIRASQLSQPQSQMSFSEPAGASSKPVLKFKGPKSRVAPEVTSDQTINKEGSTRQSSEAYGIVDTGCLVEEVNDDKQDRKTKSRDRKPAISPNPKIIMETKKVDSSAGGIVAVEKIELLSIPQTNFAIGLLVMCCFNPPFGLLALYFSLRAAAAYRDGDKSKGSWCARISIVISLLGIMLTMVIISSVVLYIAVNKHSTRKAYRRVGSTSLGF